MRSSNGFDLIKSYLVKLPYWSLFFFFFFTFSSCGLDLATTHKKVLGVDIKSEYEARSEMSALTIGGEFVRDSKTNKVLSSPNIDDLLIQEERPESNTPENNITRDYVFVVAHDPLNPNYRILYVIDVHRDLLDNLIINAYAISEDGGTGTGEISGVEKGVGILGDLETRTESARTILFGDGQKLYTAVQTPDSKWIKKEYTGLERPSVSLVKHEGTRSTVDLLFDFDRIDFKEVVKAYPNANCLESTQNPSKVILSYEDSPGKLLSPAVNLRASRAGVRDANAYTVGRTLAGVLRCSDPVYYTRFSYDVMPQIELDSSSPGDSVLISDLKNIGPTPLSIETTPTYTFSYKLSGPQYLIQPFKKANSEELLNMRVTGLERNTGYVFKATACLQNDCIDSREVYFKTTGDVSALSLNLKKVEGGNFHHLMKGFAKTIKAEIAGVVDGESYSIHKDSCSGERIGASLSSEEARGTQILSISSNVPNTFVVKSEDEDTERCSVPITYTHLGNFEAHSTSSNTTLTSFDLAWDPNSNAASFNLYLDGVLSQNTLVNNVSLSGLVPNRNYDILVKAVDYDGYESDPVPPSSIATLNYDPPTFIITNPGGSDSYGQGYSDKIEFFISGLSTLDDETISLHKSVACLDANIGSVSTNKASSVRITNVDVSLGTNEFFVARTLSGITKCSSAQSFERYSYSSTLPSVVQDAINHDTKAHVTFASQIPPEVVSSYSLFYQKDGDPDPVEISSATSPKELTDLVPEQEYSIWIKAIDTKNIASLSQVTIYRVPRTGGPPVLTLKKDASTDFHSSLTGFADTAYALITNTELGSTNTLHKDSCTGPVVTDLTSISLVEGVNTFCATSTLDSDTQDSNIVTYVKLGAFTPNLDAPSAGIKLTQADLSWDPMTGVLGYEVFSDSTLIAEPTTNAYTLTGLDPEETYTISILARDNDGYTSSNTDTFNLTLATYDPPTALITKVGGTDPYVQGYADSVDILVSNLSTEDDELISLHSLNDCSDVSINFVNSGELSSARLTVTPLLPLTNSFYVGRTLGNVTKCSSVLSFERYSYSSATPIPSIAQDPIDYSSKAHVTFSPQSPPAVNYALHYKKQGESSNTIIDPSTSVQALTGLESESTYDFFIRAYDDEGNYSDSQTISYTVPQGINVPVLTLKKDASTPLHSSMQGFATHLYGEISSTAPGTTNTLHISSCTGTPVSDITNIPITANSVNTFYLASTIGGNTVCSNPVSYTHLGDYDPGTIQQSNQKLTSFTLSFDPAGAVRAYKVYKDSILVDSPTSPILTLSNLDPDTAYSILVKAEDYDGNLSSNSSEFPFSTSTYSAPTIAIYPPSTATNPAPGYTQGFSTTVDIEISGLSDEDVETVELYAGVLPCTGTALATLSTTLTETSLKFANRASTEATWSVKRKLSNAEKCSSTSVSYTLLSYPATSLPVLSNATSDSLKLTLIPLSPSTTGSYYQYKLQKESEAFGAYITLSSETTTLTGLEVNTSYTVVASACDKHEICSSDTSPATLSTLSELSGSISCESTDDTSCGEWIWIPKINDSRIASKIPAEFRSRADGLEAGEVASEKISANGFYVMKYKASPHPSCISSSKCTTPGTTKTYKCTSCTIPTSSSSQAPWAYISQTDANTYCNNIIIGGKSARLMYNSEWMTIALNAEAQGENWNGSPAVPGAQLTRGHADTSSGTYYGGMSADEGPCLLGSTQCASDPDSTGWHQNRRTFFIANTLTVPDNVIWDLAGNAYEWTLWNSTVANLGTHQLGTDAVWQEWRRGWGTVGEMTSANSEPGYVSYVAAPYAGSGATNANYGQYYRYADTSTGAPLRAGFWNLTSYAGLFSLDLSFAPELVSREVGFRCVVHP